MTSELEAIHTMNTWRRQELLVLDDIWESLHDIGAMLGHPQSPRSEERAGRRSAWIARADRYRTRHPFMAWRAAVLRARFERRVVGSCFAAWAWHPEGALLGSLARRHGDAFGRGDL